MTDNKEMPKRVWINPTPTWCALIHDGKIKPTDPCLHFDAYPETRKLEEGVEYIRADEIKSIEIYDRIMDNHSNNDFLGERMAEAVKILRKYFYIIRKENINEMDVETESLRDVE